MVRPPSRSRHALLSRRALLKGGLGAGVVALVPGLGCGNSDADALATGGSSTGEGVTSTSSPVATSIDTTSDSTTTASTADPTAEATSDAAGPAGSLAVPAGAELVVSFTYQQAAGGKDLPPYIAVWIEDAAGDLVDTVSLWYLQERKGSRWLPDLRRWFNVDQARIEAGGADTVDVVSSATRLPGSYSVVWDGSSEAGPVLAGDYYVCIEAVRERGPYSLIREPVTLDGSSFELSLPDENELVNASMVLDV